MGIRRSTAIRVFVDLLGQQLALLAILLIVMQPGFYGAVARAEEKPDGFICRPAGQPSMRPNASAESRKNAIDFARAFLPKFHLYTEYRENVPRFLPVSEYAMSGRPIGPAGNRVDLNIHPPDGLDDLGELEIDRVLAVLLEAGKVARLDGNIGILEGADPRPAPVVYCRFTRDVSDRADGWRVQYFVLLSENTAPHSRMWSRFEGKQLNHHGDWLYFEVLVRPVREAEEQWALHQIVMKNHERYIMVRPKEIPATRKGGPEVGAHAVTPLVWLELNSHEPFPFPGGRGLIGAPPGIYYASPPGKKTKPIRDEWLDHRGKEEIEPSEIDIRVLDAAEGDWIENVKALAQFNNVALSLALDEAFAARYTGSYGFGPNGMVPDNPRGPHLIDREPDEHLSSEWPWLVPKSITSWRDATGFEGRPGYALFLDQLAYALDDLAAVIELFEDHPVAASVLWLTFIVPVWLAINFLYHLTVGGLGWLDKGGGAGDGKHGEKRVQRSMPVSPGENIEAGEEREPLPLLIGVEANMHLDVSWDADERKWFVRYGENAAWQPWPQQQLAQDTVSRMPAPRAAVPVVGNENRLLAIVFRGEAGGALWRSEPGSTRRVALPAIVPFNVQGENELERRVTLDGRTLKEIDPLFTQGNGTTGWQAQQRLPESRPEPEQARLQMNNNIVEVFVEGQKETWNRNNKIPPRLEKGR